jgi:hypothetical protein
MNLDVLIHKYLIGNLVSGNLVSLIARKLRSYEDEKLRSSEAQKPRR